ncbi:NAD(+) kinase [Psychrosphaera sp. B3R10]|uniref:NAD(+) kinase n=1 Tax=unclassified Psychrosphaera TaxID=2641570 RepID=UPI001C081518|nr:MULTISPECIES: NAD(+) kinase [unclassified Psychrosphaera]MBU2884132.1 NAD(+) kinase [Psychrosphaera sp. I2R16]MBU2989622.1 NAD(+) kinase [Psychrosphaera sp. B3R10]MDO6719331.1 NAD(+) kinase [Psychrosphaera sp. 1_MG-2023]
MTQHFKTIGLIGKANHNATKGTVVSLYKFLCELGYKPIVEENVSNYINDKTMQTADLVSLGQQCDLVIVVGGDGNMLGTARVLSRYDVAVIGVNRGNLGFLTDLDPENFDQALTNVLNGEYTTEMRYLLDVSINRHEVTKANNSAMNEVVLHADKVAHMIEFEAFIDGSFVFHQRSDGLIVSTPTGSTAYSLSGGGPIVHPNLNAMTLVPMFPHSLTSRPLVVDADSELKIVVSKSNDALLQISCDSHVRLSVMPGDEIVIKKHHQGLRLIHPSEYDYYDVLRKKLHWGRQNY